MSPLYYCCLRSPPRDTNHCLNKSLPNVNQVWPPSYLHPPICWLVPPHKVGEREREEDEGGGGWGVHNSTVFTERQERLTSDLPHDRGKKRAEEKRTGKQRGKETPGVTWLQDKLIKVPLTHKELKTPCFHPADSHHKQNITINPLLLPSLLDEEPLLPQSVLFYFMVHFPFLFSCLFFLFLILLPFLNMTD